LAIETCLLQTVEICPSCDKKSVVYSCIPRNNDDLKSMITHTSVLMQFFRH